MRTTKFGMLRGLTVSRRTEEEDWDGTGEPRPSGVKAGFVHTLHHDVALRGIVHMLVMHMQMLLLCSWSSVL